MFFFFFFLKKLKKEKRGGEGEVIKRRIHFFSPHARFAPAWPRSAHHEFAAEAEPQKRPHILLIRP
jgi:hypothetical protein